MKKYLLLSFCLICSCILNAVTIKTVKVDINMTNLSFPRDAYGQIQIIPGGDTFVFDEGENMPCLPYYPMTVSLAKNIKTLALVKALYEMQTVESSHILAAQGKGGTIEV